MKNIFLIYQIVYLLSDLSNNILEIYNFKSVENEKGRSSECNCWLLNVKWGLYSLTFSKRRSTRQLICRIYRCELSFLYRLRLIKQEVQSKGGGFDMCKAIKEMLWVSRQEGEQEGRLEGRQEGRLEGRLEGRQEGQDEMATLSEKLILADRISELLKASTDREYRNKLLAEFGLAWEWH